MKTLILLLSLFSSSAFAETYSCTVSGNSVTCSNGGKGGNGLKALNYVTLGAPYFFVGIFTFPFCAVYEIAGEVSEELNGEKNCFEATWVDTLDTFF